MTVSSGKHYLLTFGTILGRTRTLRVNNADDTLTNAQVYDAMQNLIGSAAFRGTGGQIASTRRAALIQTHVTEIELPA